MISACAVGRLQVTSLVASFAFATAAWAQWGAETPLSATGGDVWGEGIAAAGDTVHVIYGTGEINYLKSIDQGATWSSPRRLGSGMIHLTDALAADGNDVWAIYLDNIQYVSDWCCSRDLFHLRSTNGGVSWGPIIDVADGGAYFSGRNDIAVADPSNVAINYNVDVPGETARSCSPCGPRTMAQAGAPRCG